MKDNMKQQQQQPSEKETKMRNYLKKIKEVISDKRLCVVIDSIFNVIVV